MRRRRAATVSLTFLLYPCEESPKKCVAHCLELDVVAVERSKPRAIELLKELIEDLFVAAIEDGTVDKLFTPAPDEYWQRLANARAYEPPERVTKHHIGAEPIRRVDYALAAAR